jgi:tyrosine-protein phosphatase SIW14
VKAGDEKKADRPAVVLKFQRKTPMRCRRPVLRTQPNSRCSASNAGAELVPRARFFRFEPGPFRGLTRTFNCSPIGSVWRFHVPRIWIGSINGRKFSVKRKTQNVVEIFPSCLFVVVQFRINRLFFNTFRIVACHVTLLIPARFKMKRILSFLAILIFFPLHVFAQTAASAPAIAQPAYGQKLHIAGIHNAGKITDLLYRGAQPKEIGFSELKLLGITTIVDLRGEDRDKIAWEKKHAESLGMRFVHIPVSGWSPPTDEQIVQFLSLFRSQPGQKVFVHCRFGDDRTGVFTAAYRIAMEKWPPEQAMQEMYFFGFNGFWHPSMKAYIRAFPGRLSSSPALASLRTPAAQP